jgi:hypothetical protein
VDSALLEAFGLDADVLHLNHGAFGVAPVVVRRGADRRGGLSCRREG